METHILKMGEFMRLFQRRNIIICKKIHTKRVVIGLILVLLGLSIVGIFCFTNFLNPTILALAQGEAKYMGEKAVNDAISERLMEEKISYDDLVTIVTDNEGKIAALKTNMIKMNVLKAEIANLALDQIYELERIDIEVPLFNMFNNSILSGRGPMVPIKVLPIGSVETAFYNDFKSAGINQTKHEINLKVKCSVSVILPTGSTKAELETNIPIAQTVIVGLVPGSYTSVEGVEEPPADAILNLAE